MAQPFAMQFSTFWQNKIKKPQNEAKRACRKEDRKNPRFKELYNSGENWFKRRSKRTNLSQFFLFSCGCKVFQCLKQKQ